MRAIAGIHTTIPGSRSILFDVFYVCKYDILTLEVVDNLSCDSLFDCSCKELNHLQVIILNDGMVLYTMSNAL